MKKSVDSIHDSDIVVANRIFAKATVTLFNESPYFELELRFPDGSYRKLWISYKVLHGPIELAVKSPVRNEFEDIT